MTRLMKQVSEEHKCKGRREAAVDELLEITVNLPPIDSELIEKVRHEGRPWSWF